MRSEETVLARARVLNLVEALVGGVAVELLRPELQRHGLGIHLTEREARWFAEEETPDAGDPRAAMRALAWALGITSTADGDLDTIRDALDALTPAIALRAPDVIRAQRDACEGAAHAALAWVLDGLA